MPRDDQKSIMEPFSGCLSKGEAAASVWKRAFAPLAPRKLIRACVQTLLPSTGGMPRQWFASRSAYFRHCKAELFRALSPHWHGSRETLKRSLRDFLHPRRRNLRFLSGALRAASTSATLMMLILAAIGQPACAETVCYQTFSIEVGASNPFEGVVLGGFSAPALADLDADGDNDAVVGNQGGTFFYFQNTGTKLDPVFAKKSGAENPFNAIDLSYASVPALGDLDADGDLDLLTGELDGVVRYFRNEGGANFPIFAERTGSDNPFNGIDVGTTSAPSLADLDGDSDLDVLIGEYDGVFNYYLNTGNARFPGFSEQSDAANPLNGSDVGSYSRPAFIDVDMDGDLDVFSGLADGTLRYFKNTGTVLAPLLVEQATIDNPLQGFDTGDYSHPTFGDLDGDGDLDTFIGGSNLSTAVAQNVTDQGLADFTEKTGAENPLSVVLAGVGNNSSAPALGDLDADGDLDALVGDAEGTVRYYKNTGTRLVPAFAKQNGPANPLNGFFVPLGYSSPVLVDLDSDGDLDLLTGMDSGQFFFLKNTGTPAEPVFEQQFGFDNPLGTPDVGSRSTLAFGDLDGDGDLDALSGQRDGFIRYYKNFGSAQSANLIEQAGVDNPLNGQASNGFNAPVLIDIENDGDLDVFVGNFTGVLELYLNTGSATAPTFEAIANAASPLVRVDVGGYSRPAFADLDSDGDLDALVGEQDGNINYFENTRDCDFLTVSCKENITLPLDANGDLFLTSEDLDNGSSTDTIMIVSPNVLSCTELGAPTPVTLEVINLVGESGSCQTNVTVQDLTGPTVNLNGDAQVTITCGGTYTEQGAGAFDGCDATVPVVIGGDTVNTNVANTYTVTYTSEDGSGNVTQISRTVTVTGSCAEGVQSADQDADFNISLSELLRVIQYYSSQGIHCANNPGDTEDGYIPGANINQRACAPHNTDYDPQDWVISLSELIRLIQFYNADVYHPCEGSEDGFCAGA